MLQAPRNGGIAMRSLRGPSEIPHGLYLTGTPTHAKRLRLFQASFETAYVTGLYVRSAVGEEEEELLQTQIAPEASEPPAIKTLDGLRLEDTIISAVGDYSGATFTGPVELKNVRFTQGFILPEPRSSGPSAF